MAGPGRSAVREAGTCGRKLIRHEKKRRMSLENSKAAMLDFLITMAARDINGLRARLTEGAR